MKVGSVSVAYHEPRFIVPHLKHMPVDDRVVLNSTHPWVGEREGRDMTAQLAEPYAEVVQNYWPTEESQRNTGQDMHGDKDWVITLDPDEAMLKADWIALFDFLETAKDDAYVCGLQLTYYKDGVVDPPEEHRQIIAVRPHVRFVDKRVVSTSYGVAPVTVHHMSWRRTDEEVLRKVLHYAEAHKFDGQKWFDEVWKTSQTRNVHPLTPEAIRRVIPGDIPQELKDWGFE